MFEVEKPRRFHYEPRFYDPEKEKWEALKYKYAAEREKKEQTEAVPPADSGDGAGQDSDKELQYFEQRVRDLDKRTREESSKLTWRDLFRKREMPKFNYQPRFSAGVPTASESAAPADAATPAADLVEKYRQNRRRIKIKRRFDISDEEYMKPVSGTKIMLYCLVVFLLIVLILRF